MGRMKRKEGVFTRLGQGNSLHKRGHKLHNKLLLDLENKGIDKNAISFEMEGTELKVLIDPEKVSESVVSAIESDIQDFEDGIIFPPDEEELSLMIELVEAGKED